ncbi:MAG: hypothetical protein LC754_04420, partial [Acidobacteria bacterium]|nr:hypothetical protein [Acidobacteriota bacterium]
MKKLLVLLMLSLLAGQHATAQTNPATAPAQMASQAEANRLNAQVVKLYAEGKYAEALPLAIRVLEIRDQGLESEHPLVT